MKNQKLKEYETPQTTFVEVELEGNFCASVFEGGTENADGVTIEEHGFAKPTNDDGTTNYWEGDYSGSNWD